MQTMTMFGGSSYVSANGAVLTMAEVWDHFAADPGRDDRLIASPTRAPLLTPALDERTDTIDWRPVGALIRRRNADPLVQIRLVDGRTLRGAGGSRLLTPGGWNDAVTDGDFVAIPRSEPCLPSAGPVPCDPRFLAWLIAEGSEQWG